MNTSKCPRARFATGLSAAVVLLATAGHSLSVEAATASQTRTKGARAEQTARALQPPADPYAAFLEDVGTASDQCKKHADNVQTLLKQREELAAGAAPAQEKKQPSQDLAALDEKIAAEERSLAECYTKHVPAEPPTVQPTVALARDGSVIPPEKLKETYTPPVPIPETITTPPPSARESAYLDFFASLAGDTEIVRELTDDLRVLLERRREIAVRYLSAEEGVRPFLAQAIYALSQRITETVDGIASGVQMAEERATAGA